MYTVEGQHLFVKCTRTRYLINCTICAMYSVYVDCTVYTVHCKLYCKVNNLDTVHCTVSKLFTLQGNINFKETKILFSYP